MRTLLLALAALLLASCAPDDRVFDISALTPEHQEAFRAAADDLNERYGAGFIIDNERANSRAVYGRPEPGRSATTYGKEPIGLRGWKIVFIPAWGHTYYTEMVSASAHELCHVMGIGHHDGNPDWGHC